MAFYMDWSHDHGLFPSGSITKVSSFFHWIEDQKLWGGPLPSPAKVRYRQYIKPIEFPNVIFQFKCVFFNVIFGFLSVFLKI